MSAEYSVGVAYGIVVGSESDIAATIIEAYCDDAAPRLEEMSIIKFNRDYPSMTLDTSADYWSGSIKNNVIFYIGDTYKNINPKDDSYDAFYANELEPTEEAKKELSKFAAHFGIEDTPGICIWSCIS